MSTPTKKKEAVAQEIEENIPAAEEVKAEEPKISVSEAKSMFQEMLKAALEEQRVELEAKFDRERASFRTAPVSTDVKIVWTCAYDGVINKVPGINLVCSHYGETFTLSRQQFDAIVGEYRHWFEEGLLAVHHDYVEVAAEKGLRTDDEYALSAAKLGKLGSMSPADIRKLWDACDDNQRRSIVAFYKRKYIEGKEDGYKDPDRVLELNKLTGQGFTREAAEISGASLKLQPTDLWTNN